MVGDKKTLKRYRHGDVALYQIAALPKDKKELQDKTLAYSEVTGHSHRFVNPDGIKRYESNGRLYLEVMQINDLIHEEHKRLIIEPGLYEQIAEREYDCFIENARTVIDWYG